MKDTQRQQKTEAMRHEQANRMFVNNAERLIQWMAFKDFLLNDFYQSLLDLATAKEDQGIGDDFGFSIYLYNTSISHKHLYFFSKGIGLCGLSALVSQATEWLDEEISIQRGEHEQCLNMEAPPNFTVGEEMETGYLRDSLDAFADACEAIGRMDDDLWVNMDIAFYPSKDDIPKDIDFGSIETESLCYPDSLQKKVERERIKIMGEAIKCSGGNWDWDTDN